MLGVWWWETQYKKGMEIDIGMCICHAVSQAQRINSCKEQQSSHAACTGKSRGEREMEKKVILEHVALKADVLPPTALFLRWETRVWRWGRDKHKGMGGPNEATIRKVQSAAV